MILTCPSCASRYFVETAKLPPQGRTVRCSACGAAWRAEPETDAEPLDLGLTDVLGAQPAPAESDKPQFAAPHAAYRQKVEAKRRTRRAAAAGVVWAGLAVSLGVLALLAVVFRVQVVDLWPRTAGAYAALRLPVNPLGVAPDEISASQTLQDGQLSLVVSGAERNIDTQPRIPAPLKVSVYDKGGARLASREVRMAAQPIAPGESRVFSVSFVNPPLAGAQVGVDFMVEPHRRAEARTSPLVREGQAAPRLRGDVGPAAPLFRPVAARALPQGSPYALPATAQAQSVARRD